MTSQTTTPSVSRFAMTPTRGPRPSVRDVIELRARAEKAEATIERVRAALANHPKACEAHPDDDPISCGWKRAVLDVQTVLDGGESE